MEESNPHSLHIDAIRNDLNRILDEWLHLHFRLAALLVVLTILVEVCLAFFIVQSEILTTTVPKFILKFIVFPSILTALLLLIAYLGLHQKRFALRTKSYLISIIFTLICFVYYTVHSAFLPIYAIYAAAIFLTTTYADYKLTIVTSLLSVISISISELFIFWDLDKISVFANSTRLVDFLIVLSVLIGCSLVSCITIHYERRKNESSFRREVERELLKESMLFDELTGTYNRKALHNEMRQLEQTVPDQPLVFCIADVDHFKSVNDLYGHQIGDICIKEFASVLCDYFGESSVFRYGGDEFCLILKNTGIEEARQLCERAQLRLRRVEFEDVPALKPTASFGLTEYNKVDGATKLFNQADEALYEAKLTRNAIRIYQRSATAVGRFQIYPHEELPD